MDAPHGGGGAFAAARGVLGHAQQAGKPPAGMP